MKTKKDCLLIILEILGKKIRHPQTIPVSEYEYGNGFFFPSKIDDIYLYQMDFCIRNFSIANAGGYLKCSICNKIVSEEHLSSRMNEIAIKFVCNNYICRNVEFI